MVYFNDTPPNPDWARKHIIYIQNARPEGADRFLSDCHKLGYDGYAFISNKLLAIHLQSGYSGIYLPFGVDTEFFYPRPPCMPHMFDVSYVGSDIKGEERTIRYLSPAAKFNFGLFGNWRLPHRYKFWKNKPYQRLFAKIARGKIAQEDVPSLYSNSKINLNCTAQDCVDWDVVTLRTFEVLACKGFLITDRVPLAEKELHDCVVFTNGGNDLVEKIAYYLAHPEERARIAENGYRFATNYASIKSRMAFFLKYCEGIL